MRRSKTKVGPKSNKKLGRQGRASSLPELEVEPVIAPGPDVSEAIAQDAEAHMMASDEARELRQLDPDKQADWLFSRMLESKKLSRTQHYRAIADAYARFVTLRRARWLREAVLMAAMKKGRRETQRISLLRLVLELQISYSEGTHPADLKRAGHLHSRDAAAITNLLERGVPPSEVVALSERPGEGLDAWARWKPERDDRSRNQKVLTGNGQNEPSEGKLRQLAPALREVSDQGLIEGVSNIVTWIKYDPSGKGTEVDRVIFPESWCAQIENGFKLLKQIKADSGDSAGAV